MCTRSNSIKQSFSDRSFDMFCKTYYTKISTFCIIYSARKKHWRDENKKKTMRREEEPVVSQSLLAHIIIAIIITTYFYFVTGEQPSMMSQFV
jgi:hypothetical protein